jgi:ATP adenylyltransferase
MKKLYAPWRSEYTQKNNDHTDAFPICVFCTVTASDKDSEHFILHRSTHSVIMLNKYPYNSGHLLIVPYAHTANLQTLTAEVRTELMENVSRATAVLESTLKNQGCNIGINIGKAAGAGIPEHIHMHVLPRFFGDTNFLPTLADTKQISIDLHAMYRTLVTAFKEK